MKNGIYIGIFLRYESQVPKGSGGKACSGHGVPQCDDDEGKSASCICDNGWEGTNCGCTTVRLTFILNI